MGVSEKRTPAEEARAEVEAWADYFNFSNGDVDELTSRLTPVFERAQLQNETDGERYGKELRERAEGAETDARQAHARADNWRERAERAEARWERDEARQFSWETAARYKPLVHCMGAGDYPDCEPICKETPIKGILITSCPECLTVEIDDLRAQLAAAQAPDSYATTVQKWWCVKHADQPLPTERVCPDCDHEALAAARIREGQLREQAAEFANDVLGCCTPCTSAYEDAAAWLVAQGLLKPCSPGGCEHYGACQVDVSSPPDAPDVLGAVREIATRYLIATANDPRSPTVLVALATLRAAGIVE